MPEGEDEGRNYGKICMFCSRLCGVFSSIVVLLCGFLALLPGISIAPGTSYGRCLAVGLLLILSAVVMFFLEATFLGHIVDRLSFLIRINTCFKNWMRAVLYISLAFIPIVLWCPAVSTIIGMGTLFLAGAINFTLALGAKGDHSEVNKEKYRRVTLSEVKKAEEGGESAEDTS